MRETASVFIIHNLAQAEAAVSAGRIANKSVTLWSAPGAAYYVGVGWWQGLRTLLDRSLPRERKKDTYTMVLDCGSAAGFAMAAIRMGVSGICFLGTEDVTRKLADMASVRGIDFLTVRQTASDLAEVKNPQSFCLHYLQDAA
ncbi:MAG: hypothetical protein R3E60_06085 [Alphaproteobacteria bacterium]